MLIIIINNFNSFMEFLITLVSFIFSLNYIFLALYLITYLIIKKDSYPFHKCTSLCNLVCISCVVLNQVFYFIMNLLIYFDLMIIWNYTLAVHSICLYLFFGILFIMRALKVSELIRFSYYHLTFKSSNPNFIKESYKYYTNRIQRPNQDLSIVVFSIARLLVLSFLLSLCMVFEPFRCSILHMTNLNHIPDEMCKDPIYGFIAHIIKITSLTFYIIYYLTIMASIYKYQISQDEFYIKFELILNLSWIFLQFLLYRIEKMSYIESFEINSLLDHFYIICQLYLFFIRKLMTKSSYKKIIQNYNLFMRNYFAFTHLKEFIKKRKHFSNSLKLMEFWQEFYLYKVHTFKSDILKKSDLIIHAYLLYNEYFKQDYENQSMDSDSINKGINIPIDIVDQIEEASKVGFCISRKNLGKVFDDAFEIVNDKLYNLYFDLMKREDEKEKLINLFLYSEFDELKEEMTQQ